MKQGYSETEGKCYPLFFACKNDCLDIRIDGREQMKAKGKLGLQGFLSFLFLAAGWYLMQYFCAYVVLSGSMEPEIPTGSVVVVDGRKKEWNRQRGTLFFLAVGAVMLFTIRQLWHGRKIMQENKL